MAGEEDRHMEWYFLKLQGFPYNWTECLYVGLCNTNNIVCPKDSHEADRQPFMSFMQMCFRGEEQSEQGEEQEVDDIPIELNSRTNWITLTNMFLRK